MTLYNLGLAAPAAGLTLAASLLFTYVEAVYLIDTPANIRQSASTLAYDLMLYYQGNKSGEIPGILPGPPSENKGDYYWWEGGAMMGTYVDYWHFTGDSSYNKVVMEGLLHQVGENNNYMPRNFTASLGNDDQGFWGMSAMLAAESKFPNPPSDKPQWLALAQAVWNTQADPSRHDGTCGGGLRWQIPFSNAGYNYKNTIANGCFFNLGARLARYTSNSTYAQYANQTWDWLWNIGFIDHATWLVYDGAHVATDCTDLNKLTFSYNAAILAQGAAFMYNYTDGSQVWKQRVDSLIKSILSTFFPQGVAYEVACELRQGACTPDMLSFKGYVHRWLTSVTQVAPYTRDLILPTLRNSAEMAVKQCTGGLTGRRCGFYWSSGHYVDPSVDHTSGAGEAMNVLAAVSSLLVDEVSPPVTNTTGGISPGDYTGGHGRDNGRKEPRPMVVTDNVAAAIATLILSASTLGTFVWMGRYD